MIKYEVVLWEQRRLTRFIEAETPEAALAAVREEWEDEDDVMMGDFCVDDWEIKAKIVTNTETDEDVTP